MFSAHLHNNWLLRLPSQKRWLPARVPGCVHLDLERNGVIADPFWGDNEHKLAWIEHQDWTYESSFTVGQELSDEPHVDLVAEGLDTLATISLNGREVARTESMFMGYRFPVKRWLHRGRNTIRIRFDSPMRYIQAKRKRHRFEEWNDPVGGCSCIRKQQCSFGWDWAPRFPTCGIYLPISLHGWSHGRIESVRLHQEHGRNRVTLTAFPTLARPAPGAAYRGRLRLCDQTVAEADGLDFVVHDPQRWWPNGLGGQPLYDFELELLVGGEVVDRWHRRLGLRTIELDRHPDKWGECFQFVVNGVPVFAKGANWIPAHSFVSAVDRATYDDLLTSAAEANMNMLRVWGGGIYEKDDFYDLCDEKGLLVWHDFMFACSLYPGDRHFLSLVEHEAAYQVKRLAHHACLALWCGNNEIEMMPKEIRKTKRRQRAYETVFYRMLPAAVKRFDGVTPYWPSSPHNPAGYPKGINNERGGDAHFWGVWHSRKPVKTYEQHAFRFCSEFGMQSYNSPEVVATYCPPGETNVFAPTMETHQKNSAGNLIILDYLSRLYRFPKDYASLAYLSQLNQAHCMKVAVEHYRRNMPRTMGALYWQINDCWPVASWSSIEFGGNWKALHHAARRFFAPALVTAHLAGDETVKRGNEIANTIHQVNLYTVYDASRPARGILGWTLYHLDNRILAHGRKPVALRYGESVLQKTLDFADALRRHGARSLYLRIRLEIGGRVVSENTVFFTAPRFLALRASPVESLIRKRPSCEFEIEFASTDFQHQVQFHLPRTKCRATDNFFDLYPGIPHRVTVRLERDLLAAQFKRRLQVHSLVDSY